MSSLSIDDWVAKACALAAQRDPVDAYHDARFIETVMRSRLERSTLVTVRTTPAPDADYERMLASKEFQFGASRWLIERLAELLHELPAAALQAATTLVAAQGKRLEAIEAQVQRMQSTRLTEHAWQQSASSL